MESLVVPCLFHDDVDDGGDDDDVGVVVRYIAQCTDFVSIH